MVKVKIIDGDTSEIERLTNEALEGLSLNNNNTTRRKLIDIKIMDNHERNSTRVVIIYDETTVPEAYTKNSKDKSITDIPWWWPYEPWRYHPPTEL